MKCPYDPNYVTTWTRHEPKYKRLDVETPDGQPDVLHLYNNDETAMTMHQHRDCLEEECAAWQDNRCVRIS